MNSYRHLGYLEKMFWVFNEVSPLNFVTAAVTTFQGSLHINFTYVEHFLDAVIARELTDKTMAILQHGSN